MNGVWFNELHTEDLKLILSETIISPPKIKTKYIKIPGMDGIIDLTEFDGNIHYDNRTIKFIFNVDYANKYWKSIISEVNNKLHGRKMDIIMDDDPAFIWHGRVTVKNQDKYCRTGKIEIEVDADPYKYSRFTSLEEKEWDSFDFENDIMQCLKDVEINGDTEIEVIGYRKNVLPVIYAAGTVSVVCNGTKTELAEGKNKILNIVIKEGRNIFHFSGKGTISIEFRGGSL